jgi:hypothetical protein
MVSVSIGAVFVVVVFMEAPVVVDVVDGRWAEGR